MELENIYFLIERFIFIGKTGNTETKRALPCTGALCKRPQWLQLNQSLAATKEAPPDLPHGSMVPSTRTFQIKIKLN